MSEARLLSALDRRADRGRPLDLWLRDDDAVEPGAALDRLLTLLGDHGVPLTLAVIPEPTGEALAERLAGTVHVSVALHGWSHRNHARPGEKKQELGAHRPAGTVLAELAQGRAKLSALHGARALPLLVPPWNRIAPGLVEGLPGIGLAALSTFGVEKPAPVAVLNTHVDPIDWHGTRGGRNPDLLMAELAALAEEPARRAAGILTHHLVHDAAVWDFLRQLFTLTVDHPGCRWRAAGDLI